MGAIQPTRQWLRALRPHGILACAWVLFILYAYPGIMSVDSFDQLMEARAGFFTDSHPPAMAALWSATDAVVPGPFGLLAIQSTCLLAGLYLIARRALAPVAAAIAASALFLFPPIVSPMAVIWKDCLMAGFLVLGIGLVARDHRAAKLAGLVALVAATAMRYNAFAATLPVVVLLFEWRPVSRRLVRYGIAAAVWVAITIAALGINRALVDREMHFWESSFALVDITGTLAKLDSDLPDAELRPLLAPTGISVDRDLHATIRGKYTPGDFTNVVGDPPNLWPVSLGGWTPLPEAQRDAIDRAWSAIVLHHPLAYLEYRIDSFAAVLGLRAKYGGTTVLMRHWQRQNLLDHYGITRDAPPLAAAGEKLTWLVARHTPLYRPFVYLGLALVMLWLARRQRDILALVASGVLMQLSLVFLAVTPDYRYSHWLVVATCLGLVLLVARSLHPPGGSPSPKGE